MSLFMLLMSILMTVLAASLALSAVRLILGPSIPDRANAFDTMMVHIVGLVAIYAMIVKETILLDAIIVVALIGFLGTVALARYIEEGRQQ